ncbi:MAG: transcriptional regulator NrdR [Patescibacteria group bacterium]|nr:transcriptional regulator NrdR [Patescibacteria group bacterium]
MQCPACKYKDTAVVDSRESDDGMSIRRRRECIKCQHRYTTYERMETRNLLVLKKNGTRELFDVGKLERGMYKAFEKRNVDEEKIKKAIQNVVHEVLEKYDAEVPSKKIGDLALKQIKKLDKVAYIRFASVYREFVDVESFQLEIKKLIKK